MERMPGHPAVSLMIQGEGDVQWAVRLADLGDPDPPVHTYRWVPGYDGPDETRPFDPDPEEGPVPVSEWALGYVEAYNGAGSTFAATVGGADRLRRQLEAEFPVHRASPPGDRGGRYEHPAGILASFGPDPGSGWQRDRPDVRLHVCVRTGVKWQAVPEFLWECARRAHMRGGMFLSQEDVETGLTHWGNGPVPPGVMREAVPPMRLPFTPRPSRPFPGGDSDDIPFTPRPLPPLPEGDSDDIPF